MQTLDATAGRQFLGWINEVNAKLGYTSSFHPRVTPNEGRRGKARCLALWNAYLLYKSGKGPWAALAASPYNSNHFPGLAVDVGVTLPNGTNRATTPNENFVLENTCRAWGWFHDGAYFSSYEQWHYGYHGGALKIAPASISAASSKPPVSISNPTTPTKPKADTDMYLATAVNDATPPRGNIKGRLFAITPGRYVSLKDGKTYEGSIRWIKSKLEGQALKRAYTPVNSLSNEIWLLWETCNYERLSW